MRQQAEGATLRRRNVKAAWVVILLAPICAELTFSAVGMPVMWAAFPILVPMYGAGVLLIRELTVRAGGGWPTLIVMGLVYELAEDGLGLQALTSPTMYNATEWGPRVLDVNLTYWEVQVGYHIVFSVLIPILLTNLIFPELRHESYLRRRGLITVAVTAVLGVAMLRGAFANVMDPGYEVPLPVQGGLVVAILALSFLALRVLAQRYPAVRPGNAVRSDATVTVPNTWVVGLVALVAAVVFLGLLMPAGHPPSGPAIGTGAWVYLPMAAAAALAIGVLLLIRHWSTSSAMTDIHRIWLAGGALVGHTLFVVITVLMKPETTLTTTLALTTGPVVIALTVVLLARLAKRVHTGAGQPRPDHAAVDPAVDPASYRTHERA